MNCWEYNQCGREPGGKREQELGVCPAAVDENLNGVHGGRNAGRSCWIVAGTFCDGTITGVRSRKIATCTQCDFYQRVKEEEGSSFIFSGILITCRKNGESPIIAR